MDKYGVVGNPIQHSLSPQIHQAFSKQTQQNLSYEKYLVELSEFEITIKDFQRSNFKGLNITVPFKERAFAICDELSIRAKLAGAVNTILFEDTGKIYGDNTDGIGLLRDISINHNFSLENKAVLLVGAGGAARGIIKPIIDAKPKILTITNRTYKKAEHLANEFAQLLNITIESLPFSDITQCYDCIINATAMGLENAAFPLSGKIISNDCCCYDMVYNKQTSFLKWAKANEASLILDGLGMLVEQAAESFYLWRGVRPNTKDILKHCF